LANSTVGSSLDGIHGKVASQTLKLTPFNCLWTRSVSSDKPKAFTLKPTGPRKMSKPALSALTAADRKHSSSNSVFPPSSLVWSNKIAFPLIILRRKRKHTISGQTRRLDKAKLIIIKSPLK